MKKVLAMLAALTITFSMVSCGNTDKDVSSMTTSETTTTTSAETTTADTTKATTTSEAESSEVTKDSTTTTKETTTTTKETTTVTTTEVSKAKETTTDTKPSKNNVKLSIPTSKSMADLDSILIDIIKNKGYEVNYTEDTIEFSAPQSDMNAIAEEFRNTINSKYSVQNGEICSVTINEDYTEMTFYVTSNFENSVDSLALLLLMQPMCELQMLTGVAESDIDFTQIVINNDTQEVIDTINIPEDFQE